MTVYRHTQVGTVVLVLVGIAVILSATLFGTIGTHPIAIAVVILLVLCLAMFGSLTVVVTEQLLRVRFGPGPIGRTFPASAIQRATIVRNPWYYGWGIRWFPRGWLFNVSGLDAVELVMLDGRVYRIGTDEPRELLAAIQRVRNNAS